MPAKTKTGTREIPLEFAKVVTQLVNKELEDESLFEKVSPITKDLLTFWNPKGGFAEVRTCPNFHKGQWQAILNTIYIHEVLKALAA